MIDPRNAQKPGAATAAGAGLEPTPTESSAEGIRDEAARILGLIVVPLLIGAMIVAALNETLAWERGRELQMASVAGSRVAALEQYILLHLAAVSLTADTFARRESQQDPEARSEVLARTHRIYPGLLTMLVADQNGRVTLVETWQDAAQDRAMSLAGGSVADRDYFIDARRTLSARVSGLLRGRRLGTDLIVALAAPIVVDGRFRGIVQGALNRDTLEGLIAGPSLAAIGLSVDLVDQDGRVVGSSGGEPAELMSRYESRSGEGAVVNVDGIGWTLHVRDDLPWYATRVGRIWLLTLGGVIVVLLVSRWILRTLASRIAEPLEELARRVAAVDVAEAAPERTIADDPPDSPREVLAISGAVGRLLQRIATTSAERVQALRAAESANRVLSVVVADRDGFIASQTAALEAALQEAQQAVAAKDRLLANTSHEIRTPLVAVLGHAELLLASSKDTDTRQRIESIIRNANSLLALMDDLLAFARVRLDIRPVERGVFDPGALVDHVAATFAGQAAAKGLALVVERGTQLPARVLGDERRCEQILANLVSNAIKYTVAGRVVIAVDLHGEGSLCFNVIDTGAGIDDVERRHMFEPFVRGTGVAPSIQGTGLGLSIVRELVEHLGGVMEVDSTPGTGSRFSVAVPVDVRTVDPLPDPSSGAPREPAAVLDVLVVDDNEVNRDVVHAQIETLGHRAAIAADGESALAMIRSQRFDLVLLDCRMPGLDGYEVARRLRDYPPAHRPWIVGFTAQVQDGERDRCIDAGMDDYRAKPLRLRDLRDLLARVVAAPGDSRR